MLKDCRRDLQLCIYPYMNLCDGSIVDGRMKSMMDNRIVNRIFDNDRCNGQKRKEGALKGGIIPTLFTDFGVSVIYRLLNCLLFCTLLRPGDWQGWLVTPSAAEFAIADDRVITFLCLHDWSLSSSTVIVSFKITAVIIMIGPENLPQPSLFSPTSRGGTVGPWRPHSL